MSAFHPAVYAALYVALREHEECSVEAAAAANVYDTSAQAAYYDEAIAGLQEAIAVLHAGDADARLDDLLIAQADGDPLAGWERELLESTPGGDLTADEVETQRNVWAEEAAAEEAQLRADTDPRAAALADARQMLDFLAANPGLPFDGLRIQPYLGGADEEDRAEVDRVAAILGVTATETGYRDHYAAKKSIGRTEYKVVAVSESSMQRWHDQLRLGEAALTAVTIAAEQAPADSLGGAWEDPAVRRAVREEIQSEQYDAAEAEDVREIRREMDIDAGDDSEALRQEAEDDASNERYAAVLAAGNEARRMQTRRQRAIDCDGSCNDSGVCAFGPHDPLSTYLTTPSTTEPEEAP